MKTVNVKTQSSAKGIEPDSSLPKGIGGRPRARQGARWSATGQAWVNELRLLEAASKATERVARRLRVERRKLLAELARDRRAAKRLEREGAAKARQAKDTRWWQIGLAAACVGVGMAGFTASGDLATIVSGSLAAKVRVEESWIRLGL